MAISRQPAIGSVAVDRHPNPQFLQHHMDPHNPTPDVTCIIPVYNSEKYLEETLECICNQTLPNVQIVCVDNGSTDSSPNILAAIATKYAGVEIITLPTAGAGAARNAGLAAARGKYVSFHDSDDLFAPDMLETLYRQAEQKAADIVIGMIESFDETGKTASMPHQLDQKLMKKVNPRGFCPRKELEGHLFELAKPWVWGKLYRRQFIEDNNLSFLHIRRAEDVPFAYLALYLADKVCVVNQVFTRYRIHADSLSHSIDTGAEIFIEAYRHLRSRLRQLGASATAMKSFYREMLGCILYQVSLMSPETRLNFLRLLREKVHAEFDICGHLATDEQSYWPLMEYANLLLPPLLVGIHLHHETSSLKNCLQSLFSSQTRVHLYTANATQEALDSFHSYAAEFPNVTEITTSEEADAPARRIEITPDRFIIPGMNIHEVANDQPAAEDGIIHITRHTRQYRRCRLFYECTVRGTKYKFLGIPILSIKPTRNRGKRIYFLGIRIAKLK